MKVEQPVQTTTTEEQLEFTERNAAGYLLRWTTLSEHVEAAADRQAMAEQMAAAWVGKPIVIQTDTNGAPLSVVNIIEVRALFAASFAAMTASIDKQFAADPQEKRDGIRKTFDSLADSYRNMSDAQLSALVIREPSTVFGFGDDTFTRGRPIIFSRPLAVPLSDAKITATTRVDWGNSLPGEIAIAVSTRPEPNEVTAAVRVALQKMLAGMPADQREQLKAYLDRVPPMPIIDDLELTLDAKTGLPRRAEHRTATDMGVFAKSRTESYAFAD